MRVCEKDRASFYELVSLLKAYDEWTAYPGSVAEVLDEILAVEVQGAPLFAFMDPFGLSGVSFQMLEKILSRPKLIGPTWQPPTELLLNISISGIRRNAGHLTSKKDYKARDTFLVNVDSYFGGDWWRPIWRTESGDRIETLVTQYCERLAAIGSGGDWVWWWFPVSNRWDGPTKYFLAFFTHHIDGVWTFNQALSGAREEYYDYCHQDQLDLDPLAVREARWISEISSKWRNVCAH